ncbi:hypothetical protein M5K25_006557 [Dendrobium thyrsiflorum]|uniref:K Homology domain-containing protein n=1 Tax=Dendrobium thyrsiflorum TaxID=117978 RepID=A0ABD0VIZ8_DENTH
MDGSPMVPDDVDDVAPSVDMDGSPMVRSKRSSDDPMKSTKRSKKKVMSNYLRGVIPDVLCDLVDVQLQVNDAIVKLTETILVGESSSEGEQPIRRPMYDRTYSGHRYVLDVLAGHPGRAYQCFRLPPEAFVSLTDLLVSRGHLRDTKDMLAAEQLGIFLRGVAHDQSYRQLCEFFQHSLETVSRYAVQQELFNHRHAQLRNVVERTFGIWKERFQVLTHMRQFPITVQADLVIACAVLHNYIGRYHGHDMHFNMSQTEMEHDNERGEVDMSDEDPNLHTTIGERIQGEVVRHDIATDMWNDRRSEFPQGTTMDWQGAPASPSSHFVKKILRLEIPVDKYPNFNFVGRLLGPRGNSLKRVEASTGCRVYIRGKGSIKDPGKEETLMGRPGYEHLNEPLHVLIEAELPSHIIDLKLRHAQEILEELLKPVEESHDYYKRQQLRELAILNSGLREDSPLPTGTVSPFNASGLKRPKTGR